MIQKIKRPVSILLVLMMVVGMFTVLPISAGAADYVEGIVSFDDLAAGDTLSASSGDYLRLRRMDSSVIIKGGTYIVSGDSEPQANDTEFQAEQIIDMMIRGTGGAPSLIVYTDGDYKEYFPINAERNNLSDKWYVLSNENGTVTLAGHVPADTWTFKLNSNFSGEWNADTDVVSEQSVELTLAAGDYEFQIVAYKNGTLSSYRGNVQAGSSTDTYSQVMHDGGGNAKFHANGGKYELTYNAGTGVAAITKTAAGLSTWADVKAAAANGGSYVLLNDIYYCESADDLFNFAPAAVANDLSIDGNGYGFKAKNTTWGGYYDALFTVNAGKKLSLSNMSYNGTDGYNGSSLVGAVCDALVVAADGADVTLTNVTATALRGENAVVLNGASTADITRCAFNNTYLDGDDIKIDSAASVTLDDTDATVGTVDGYKVVEDNGTYTAAPVVYVAEDVATGNKYETVNDAVKAAGENGEVKLIADINIAAGELNVGIDGDYTTTLDLNGHTINNAAGSGITLYSKYPGGKTFTIKDTSENQTGAITINKKYPGDGCISDSSGRKVVIEGGIYTSDANALYVSSDEGWTIKGGTFNGNIKVVSGLDIQGGTINGNINATGPSWTVDPAEVTISGGTVNGSLNSENGSTFEVSGGTFTDDVSEYTTVDTYQKADGEVVPKAANTIYDDGDFAKAAAEGGNWYIVADVNAAGVTVTSDLKVWNTDKTHTITGDFTVDDNTAFATAGKKTTNINGDITLAGQDSKVSSTRANKVILTQPYKTGQVYGVPAATKVIYDGKEIVFDSISLTNAASKGGEFYVVDDFTMNAAVSPSKNLSLVGLKADGSRPTITVASTSSTRTAFNLFNPTNGTDLSIENINFAATKTDEKVIGVVNTNTASSADKYSTITIKDSEISGFSVADNYGAVYLHGYSHATLTNVEMSGNGKYDVWAGAAADVTISDGSYESVYLNGGVAKATVADGAAITEIVAAEGTTIAADSYTNVNVGDGYKLVDNGDGSKTVVAKNYVAEIGTTKYETLEAAFAAANDGETITVLTDCAGNGIKAPQGKFATGLTVDFAGHTYTVSGTPVGSTGTETIGFQLLKDNKITFKGGTITGDSTTNPDLLRMIQNYSDLTLDNMTVSMVGQYYDQITVSTCNGKTVIKDSKISAPDYTWAGITDPATVRAAALTVGTFSSYPSIDVTVEGTSVINGDVNVSDDNNKKAFSLTLKGGELNGKINLDENAKAAINDTASTANVTKANSFTQEAPADFRWVDNGNGTSTLAPIPYVAEIGTTKYETLEEAFAAAQDGDIITVLADCAGNGIKAPQGKFATGLTVDFAGHTYTVSGTPVGSTGTETIGFQLLKDNKITFKGGTITGNSNENTDLQRMIQNYSDLTLENMTVSMVGRYYNQITVSTCNGKTVIKDSTISAPDFTWAGYDDPAEVGAAALTVGTFSSYPSIDVTVEGNSTINGDVNVSDDNNKKAFSLKLNGGELNGKINLDENAKAAIDDTESTANVTKADTFDQEAPAGYEWVDNGNNTSTLAKVQDLFPGHSITLNGNINLNFYINTKAIPNYANANSVIAKFTWDSANDHIEVNLKSLTPDGNGWVKAYVPVNAAQMANTIKAVVEVNGTALAETNDYSVKEYAETIINGNNYEEADKKLVKEMLNYGAMAQKVFERQLVDNPAELANAGLSEDDLDAIATEMNNVTSDDILKAVKKANNDQRGATIQELKNIGTAIGGEWYTTSVIFLDGNTIRHYFNDVNEGGMNYAGANGVQDTWFHYVEQKNIPASQLDTLYTFTIGGQSFQYSVLDYAAAVIDSRMGEDAENLAKALYLYNQAANAKFGN